VIKLNKNQPDAHQFQNHKILFHSFYNFETDVHLVGFCSILSLMKHGAMNVNLNLDRVATGTNLNNSNKINWNKFMDLLV
jgi:hypothetical protein